MIVVNLDVMMAKRKMSLNELSERVGITLANLSILKNGKAKAVRLSTLDAICRALEWSPLVSPCHPLYACHHRPLPQDKTPTLDDDCTMYYLFPPLCSQQTMGVCSFNDSCRHLQTLTILLYWICHGKNWSINTCSDF